MKATLPTPAKQNAKNHGDKKELIHSYKVIAYEPQFLARDEHGIPVENPLHKSYQGNFQEIIDLRLYMSRSGDGASPIYGSIWINGNNQHTSGSGMAGGYGYHKGSAAAGDAIVSAGIKLDRDINGRGDSAIREALTDIAQAMGFNNTYVVEA
jgi:hypothetical protein